MNWEQILDTLASWAMNVGIKIIIALVLLFVSFKLINWLGKRILKSGEKNLSFFQKRC